MDHVFLSVDEARVVYAEQRGFAYHPDLVGLMIPTYPEGTREYADYSQALTAALKDWTAQ